MTNLIGSHPPLAELTAIPKAHVHLYGKMPAPGRKLGHVTVLTSDPVETQLHLSKALRQS
jgi:5-(carboxyamino)imidazole ribonucleotide synthase